MFGIIEMKTQGAPVQSGEKLVLNPASNISVKLSATSCFLYHWVHEEVCPSPGLSLHEVGVRAIRPDLKRILLTDDF